jgi:hypothetical protein
MIPAEAVTKLRQKHPGTIRVAEENRGTLVQVTEHTYLTAKNGEYPCSGKTTIKLLVDWAWA